MADRDKGTDYDCASDSVDGGWYLVREAECSSFDELEHLFEVSTEGSDISNLLDDDCVVNEGEHQQGLNEQINASDALQIQALKRKYLTPSPQSKVPDLSPRLASISISPSKSSSKRRLFEDSGIESLQQNETEDIVEGAQVNSGNAEPAGQDSNVNFLRTYSSAAALFTAFKDVFGIGLKELMRPFKSEKTCSHEWVACVYGAREEVIEGSKTLLQQHCDFFQMNIRTGALGFLVLYLLSCKTGKSKETLKKMLMTVLNVSERQIYADPPRNRSLPVALFFYKKGMAGDCFKHGAYPDWLAKQVLVTHQARSETFELSTMVQWAYDNKYTDEAEIAFHYARLAEEDANAEAWLKSNSQAKYVRDCAQMVKLYLRQEMRQTTISEWIDKCCQSVTEDGDWGDIMRFLKYQQVNFTQFLTAMRNALEGKPKKNCLVFYGPPDTGKSYFCFSLVSFMQGKVVNFMNSKSHFWLMPLTETKMGMLDDATHACWSFIDTYMRNALDGNPVSVDCKHRVPVQIKLPPLLITSNIDIFAEDRYRYLYSRVQAFKFPNPFPFTPFNKPVYSLTNASWKSFFIRLRKQLGLQEPEEDQQDGESERSL
nr:E1 [Felis catus papillomavirus 3]